MEKAILLLHKETCAAFYYGQENVKYIVYLAWYILYHRSLASINWLVVGKIWVDMTNAYALRQKATYS